MTFRYHENVRKYFKIEYNSINWSKYNTLKLEKVIVEFSNQNQEIFVGKTINHLLFTFKKFF